ncbi:uncharacterized protein arl15b isoform X2 [Hemibagrus wyckioides]|uniref:uncharacterized protein arl15b isoform X2 n=1 Tax=Hemibagrus wyckioides TaxID=337641 RepID=UPI00266BC1D7|nr:uncharacterized protein arl15b isoform X2 [Hemibagrus wyckioides]
MQSLYTGNSLGSLILQPGFHFPEDDSEVSRHYMDYLCFRTLCCKGPPPPRPEYDVVCIGLTGSGKTSLLSRLCNEAADTIVPTTGFSIKAVPFQNAILNVKELGGFDLSPLVPVKKELLMLQLHTKTFWTISCSLWEQFGDDPFLFQHDCTPVTKARSIKTWMSEFGVEELDCPAQSPDLNPIEHLWDELEWRLPARPSRHHNIKRRKLQS